MREAVYAALPLAVALLILLVARVTTRLYIRSTDTGLVRAAARAIDDTYRQENRAKYNYRDPRVILVVAVLVGIAAIVCLLPIPIPREFRYGLLLAVLVMTPDAAARLFSQRGTT